MTSRLAIVSGEGESGTREEYTGKRTARAIRARLTRERCGGDRWARLQHARCSPECDEDCDEHWDEIDPADAVRS